MRPRVNRRRRFPSCALRFAAMSLLFIAVGACGPRTAERSTAAEDEWRLADEDRYLPAIDVLIETVEEFGDHRYSKEIAGLVLALFEAGLADVSTLVPHYQGHAPPPGVDRWLTGPSQHWRARLRFAYEGDSLRIVLRLCPEVGACKGASATGPRDAPEGAVTELLVWSTAAIGTPVPPGMVETWSRPLSADRYAVLILGRAAATLYGIIDAVEPTDRGNPDQDPMTRVVLIDPSLALAQYLLGRRSFEFGRFDAAARSFEHADQLGGQRFVFRAATAAAVSAVGQGSEARKLWDALDANWPGDSRFAAPRIESYLASGATDEAKRLLEELADRFAGDPTLARLRVQVAEEAGPGPGFEELIEAWEAAAAFDPEPVRKHISLRLRDGRLAEAFELITRLEDRGAATEAQQLMVALGAELGRYDEAAKQAAKLGKDELSEKLKLRGALGRNPREAPPQLLKATDSDARLVLAKILASREPEAALGHVRAVLRQQRFRAEAIALEIKVLERLGREEEAVGARERLQFADPAFVSGPRMVAGSTAAGSQPQVSLPE